MWGSNVLTRPDFWMVWRYHSVCSFLFRTNIKKGYLNEASSTTVMAIFSMVLLRKLIDHIYVQCSFSRIATHIENSTLKEILQLKILWTWIKIRVNTFIKTLVNIMKQKSTKVLWKLSFTKKTRPRTSKNIASKWIIFHLLLYASFFLKFSF